MKYWTFEFDGDIHNAECDTKEAVHTYAQTWFWNKCSESDEYKYSRCEDMDLIEFSYNDENGERIISKREPIIVEYEYEPSEYERL